MTNMRYGCAPYVRWTLFVWLLHFWSDIYVFLWFMLSGAEYIQAETFQIFLYFTNSWYSDICVLFWFILSGQQMDSLPGLAWRGMHPGWKFSDIPVFLYFTNSCSDIYVFLYLLILAGQMNSLPGLAKNASMLRLFRYSTWDKCPKP